MIKGTTVAIIFLVIVGGFWLVLTTNTPAPSIPPNMGQLEIAAWYSRYDYNGQIVSNPVAVTVTVSGPSSTSGTTTTNINNPLKINLPPGLYVVSGTYGGQQQSATVTVVLNQVATAVLYFGVTGYLPPVPA